MIDFYGYKNCSTCTLARKKLIEKQISFKEHDVLTDPPGVDVLRNALKAGLPLKKLLNASGKLYRELGMPEKVKKLSEDEILAILSKNGMLVKRPLVLGRNRATAGYREAEFLQAWV